MSLPSVPSLSLNLSSLSRQSLKCTSLSLPHFSCGVIFFPVNPATESGGFVSDCATPCMSYYTQLLLKPLPKLHGPSCIHCTIQTEPRSGKGVLGSLAWARSARTPADHISEGSGSPLTYLADMPMMKYYEIRAYLHLESSFKYALIKGITRSKQVGWIHCNRGAPAHDEGLGMKPHLSAF